MKGYVEETDTVGQPLFWFLIVQKKVLKGGDAGEYFVIGGYEGSSCLWHETDEGFGYQFTKMFQRCWSAMLFGCTRVRAPFTPIE